MQYANIYTIDPVTIEHNSYLNFKKKIILLRIWVPLPVEVLRCLILRKVANRSIHLRLKELV